MNNKYMKHGFQKIALLALMLSAMAPIALKAEKSGSCESRNVGVQEVIEHGAEMLNEELVLDGFIIAACKHGGRKGFIRDIGGEYEGTLRVACVDDCKSFTQDLAGQTLRIKGKVRESRMYAKDIDAWEAQMEAEEHEHAEEGESCHNCPDKADEAKLRARIEEFRKTLKDSGKDYISTIWFDATEWEVVNAQ